MFRKARDNISMFLMSQVFAWRSAVIYRTQFLLYSIYSAMNPLFMLVFVSIIYKVSNGIMGWSYFQLLLLIAVTNTVFFAFTYFISYSQLSDALREGKLDPNLLKPYSPFVMMIAQFPNNYQLGGVIGGIALMAYALLNLHPAAAALIAGIALMLLGIAMLVMLLLMFDILTYNFFGSGDYIDWLTGIFSDVSNYPISIYGLFGAFVLTFVLPIGLASYYPVEALLGQLNITTITVLAVATLSFTLLARKLAYFALKKYASGGG